VINGETVFHDAARHLIKQEGSAAAALAAALLLRDEGTTDRDRSFWRAMVGILTRAKRTEKEKQ
jgi:hypothetical protein